MTTMHDATTERGRRSASAKRFARRVAALAPLLIVAACASERFSDAGPAPGGYRSARAVSAGADGGSGSKSEPAETARALR
jgi:hypothetical protein